MWNFFEWCNYGRNEKRSKTNPNVQIETNKNPKFEKNNENQPKEVACLKKIVKTT